MLLTGASGFIGNTLCCRLLSHGHQVRVALRRSEDIRRVVCGGQVELVVCGNLFGEQDWREALADVDAVLHLAADSRNLRRANAEDRATYDRINNVATRNLARQASAAGVRRFVYVSSVKVLGETSRGAFRDDDVPAPVTPYGVSKLAAERGLIEIASRSALSYSILRPPLVYGPGMRGAMLHLLGAVARGIPLPLGATRNRRSFLHVLNLVDAIEQCAIRPEAANRTFLLDDGEAVSISAWLRRFAFALGRRPFLLPIPKSFLRTAAWLIGRLDEMDRLTADLEVDGSNILTQLHWRRPFDLDAGIEDTAVWLRRVLEHN